MALADFISKIVTSITRTTFQFNKSLDVLIDKFKEGCPTTQELRILIAQKNDINGALEQIEQKIATLNKVAKGSEVAAEALNTGKTVIKQLPAPSAVPPGVGLPLNIFNNFSDALDNLGTLIDKEKASLDTIPEALNIIEKDVGTVFTKLKKLDEVLNKCLEEDPNITQEDFDDIDDLVEEEDFIEVLTNAELEKALSEPPGLLYGDYYLRKQLISSEFSFNKKQITAQNKESVLDGEYYKEGVAVEMLYGDESFSSSNLVLVNEMKWLIDTKDLIFPPPPPAEDPLKAIYKAGQIVVLMSIYGANEEEANELYEMAWELSQNKGPNKGYYDTLVREAFNNSRTVLEQAVANEGYEWKEGDRVLDSTIKKLFLGGVTDEIKIKGYISQLRKKGSDLEKKANNFGGAFNPTKKTWENDGDNLFNNTTKLYPYSFRLSQTGIRNNDNLGSFESLRPEITKRRRLMQAIFEEANYLSLQNPEISFNDPLSEYFLSREIGYNMPSISGFAITGDGTSPISFEEVKMLWEWEIDKIWTLWFISNIVPDSYPEEAIFDGKPVIKYDPNNSAMSYDWNVNGNFLSFVKTQLFLKLREALGVEWYNANALTTSELPFWYLKFPNTSPGSIDDKDPNQFIDQTDPWYFEFGKNNLPTPTGS